MQMNPILDKNIKEINGPTNIVRLEGSIGSVKKIIYLFFDTHLEVSGQTECDNIFAKDVQMYFADNFNLIGNISNNNNNNNRSKMVDFFLEIDPEEIIGTGGDFQREITYSKFQRKIYQRSKKIIQKIIQI